MVVRLSELRANMSALVLAHTVKHDEQPLHKYVVFFVKCEMYIHNYVDNVCQLCAQHSEYTGHHRNNKKLSCRRETA